MMRLLIHWIGATRCQSAQSNYSQQAAYHASQHMARVAMASAGSPRAGENRMNVFQI
ncbi:hypothetical protein [Cupriavidus basilensis]|uniref:hypothetical protein n=1 Tax=Cupriavidus basilensis TaxID=68895 RepID=UPI0020A683E4|nr:hypothetical protein [Cupriavidus basilensis]MCP3024866.1 hypothetical protein [Cupriavidus basilensis]MDR3380193.1 hypothetical protein [Cupriavidus basilensis]